MVRLLHYADGEYRLATFYGRDIPHYAILSHTWGSGEVGYQDMISGMAKMKKGYKKIKFCGEQALRDGLQYFWVDTCCINKSDGSEVSAAINSMFKWYKNAVRCYVFLSDVSRHDGHWDLEGPRPRMSAFAKSRWFTRAWTLQELLASNSTQFFCSEGRFLGDRKSMGREISDITGIPFGALRRSPLSEFSVAERMSWAANRQCLREEDSAYSLLGIFEVHMPLEYGEGASRALRRLQEEIRRSAPRSTDSSQTGMRLLLTKSNPLHMKTVPLNNNLQYAIFSHTWGSDEVSFDDLLSSKAEQRRGYTKLRQCCNLAAKHGFDYVWIDTCCIDKSSSSELQEAICSMYSWYKNATICYVYLEDYEYGNVSSLSKCKWFTRGWTLQELIAPASVEFHDRYWNEIGTKRSLCDQIAKITLINPLVLRGANPTSRTVAERMSWAAGRSTTRIEDAAYSLMGLVDVFMPMLYGEGKRAFIRLQEEIIKQTEDYTIFSWAAEKSASGYRGIFAHSPSEFSARTSAVKNIQNSSELDYPWLISEQHPPPVLTSRGLHLALPITDCFPMERTLMGCIGWSDSSNNESAKLVCVLLQEIQSSPQVYARISPEKVELRPMADIYHFTYESLCILPSNIDQIATTAQSTIGQIMMYPPTSSTNVPAALRVSCIDESRCWDMSNMLIFSCREAGPYALAAIHFEVSEGIVVVIGLDDNEAPWCDILTREEISRHGKTFQDLDSLHLLSKPFGEHADRAEKRLSDFAAVTAALRPAPCTNLVDVRFDLHVKILEQ